MSDESEHAIEQAELAAWDMAKALQDEEAAKVDVELAQLQGTCGRLGGQMLHLAAKNAELIMALEQIAKKRKMDAVAASSMRSIAIAALTSAGIKVS